MGDCHKGAVNEMAGYEDDAHSSSHKLGAETPQQTRQPKQLPRAPGNGVVLDIATCQKSPPLLAVDGCWAPSNG